MILLSYLHWLVYQTIRETESVTERNSLSFNLLIAMRFSPNAKWNFPLLFNYSNSRLYQFFNYIYPRSDFYFSSDFQLQSAKYYSGVPPICIISYQLLFMTLHLRFAFVSYQNSILRILFTFRFLMHTYWFISLLVLIVSC